MSFNLRRVVERKKQQMIEAMTASGANVKTVDELREMSFTDLEHEYAIFKHNQMKEEWLNSKNSDSTKMKSPI
ncbi:Fur-regulated basic protein FbpA [Alteribacillus sp. HJP-4]|uniref:Fur-regulated basic protein FbpA n=1 Tax=Alteribacillus sp. HJP-4 TaxID=2775394 RepID=UPI0035CD05E4